MATMDYDLFDSVVFDTGGNVDHVLFQVTEGADATHDKQFTNMRGSGSLPPNEAFTIERILFTLDDDVALADVQAALQDAWLEVRLSDNVLLRSPLKLFVSHNQFGGQYSQATASDDVFLGLMGDGYKLKNVIKIPGGTGFRVTVHQDAALSANTQYKVILCGVIETR